MGIFFTGFGRQRQRRLERNKRISKEKRRVEALRLAFVAGGRGQAAKRAFPSSLLITGRGVPEPGAAPGCLFGCCQEPRGCGLSFASPAVQPLL